MRKFAIQLEQEIAPPVKTSRWPKVVLVLFLIVGLAPLAIEGASLCLANWKEALGMSASVSTPAIDSVQETFEDARAAFWGEIMPYFRRLPWDPKTVLCVGGVVMAVAMMMLKR